MELNFYYPNGEKIYTLDEFITFYSKAYYIGQYIEVEKIIDDILEKGIKSKSDIIKIIGWKVGAIDMKATYLWNSKKTSPNKEFFYRTRQGKIVSESYLVNNEEIIVNTYGREIPVVRISNEIFKILDDKGFKKPIDELYVIDDEKLFKKFFRECWDDLFKDSNGKYVDTKGIGSVYRLTILYFYTIGMFPIYDKFADVAITAIIEDKKPFHQIKYLSTLPKKEKTNINGICDEYYKFYKKMIADNDLIETYFHNRNVDRALWTYGHLFTIVD